jgi:hypothetical protein
MLKGKPNESLGWVKIDCMSESEKVLSATIKLRILKA